MSIDIHSIVDRLFYEKNGQLLVSIVFGLAIALMFRRVCKENCIIFYSPNMNDIINKKFELEGTCYKYIPINVKCTGDYIKPNINNVEGDNKIEEKGFFSKIFN
jgi:hypothetical protein